MGTASLVLVILSLLAVLVGLFPCLGWLNWFGGILCLITIVMGIVGLTSDKDAAGSPRNKNAHLGALIGGIVLGVIALIRLLLGGGVV